jgi:hypothetical protein
MTMLSDTAAYEDEESDGLSAQWLEELSRFYTFLDYPAGAMASHPIVIASL